VVAFVVAPNTGVNSVVGKTGRPYRVAWRARAVGTRREARREGVKCVVAGEEGRGWWGGRGAVGWCGVSAGGEVENSVLRRAVKTLDSAAGFLRLGAVDLAIVYNWHGRQRGCVFVPEATGTFNRDPGVKGM